MSAAPPVAVEKKKAWSNFKWADAEDNPLSPKAGEGPQTFLRDGIKTVTEIKRENGRRVRIVKRFRIIKKPMKVNKHVLARRKWAKFGACAGAPPGPEPNVTYVSSNEVVDLADLKPQRREDATKEQESDPLISLKAQGSIVTCHNCGQRGHWTRLCPKPARALGAAFSDEQKSGPGGEKKGLGGGAGGPGGGTGKYVPVHLRGGEGRGAGRGVAMLRERDDSATLRVTNLSEDTTEDDLRELFGPFGKLMRVYLAKDQATRESRGFAFINFDDKRAAEQAIAKLNGHPYGHLILRVEWAKPREGGEEGGGGRGGGRGR